MFLLNLTAQKKQKLPFQKQLSAFLRKKNYTFCEQLIPFSRFKSLRPCIMSSALLATVTLAPLLYLRDIKRYRTSRSVCYFNRRTMKKKSEMKGCLGSSTAYGYPRNMYHVVSHSVGRRMNSRLFYTFCFILWACRARCNKLCLLWAFHLNKFDF